MKNKKKTDTSKIVNGLIQFASIEERTSRERVDCVGHCNHSSSPAPPPPPPPVLSHSASVASAGKVAQAT